MKIVTKIIIAIIAWSMMPLAFLVVGFEVAKAYAEDLILNNVEK